MSGDQIIAYSLQHQTSFCFIISSQTPLPTSSLNRPSSQRSWLSHLSILNVLAWAGCRFALNSTTVTYHPQFCLSPKMRFYHISLCWIKAQLLRQQNSSYLRRCNSCCNAIRNVTFLIIKCQHFCHILTPFDLLLIPKVCLLLALTAWVSLVIPETTF